MDNVGENMLETDRGVYFRRCDKNEITLWDLATFV